jgi:DNA-binding response OmpR family regulator
MDSKKKILLVEDDENLSAVYRDRLLYEGFDVSEVRNGEDALAAALAHKPDLIVLDAMMPKVSGFDVLDILRNTPETANVRVIMLTALSQEKDKQRAESLGVDEYLVKSQVVINDVVEKIKQHLGVVTQTPTTTQTEDTTPSVETSFATPDSISEENDSSEQQLPQQL